jgi:hypothetical protein
VSDQLVHQRFAAFLRESNLANNRAQRAQSEFLHVFPSGYHTTLPVHEISKIPTN